MNEKQRYLNNIKRAQRVLDIAMRMAKQISSAVTFRIEEVQLHYNGYAGDCDEKLIATGNWNDVDGSTLPSRIQDLFEAMGIETEWSDEWTECSECYGLIRTEPDSYHWVPEYTYIDGYVCHACLKKDPEGYLSSLESCPESANTVKDIDPSEYGYVKFNDGSYRTGYSGASPSPSTIAEYMGSRAVDRYLFHIDSVGQFDCEWSVYVHRDEIHLFEDDPGADEPTEYIKSLAEMAMSSGLSEEIEEFVNKYVGASTVRCSSSGTSLAFSNEELIKAVEAIVADIGSTQVSVVNCTNCGKENDRGVTECWWCGQNPEA